MGSSPGNESCRAFQESAASVRACCLAFAARKRIDRSDASQLASRQRVTGRWGGPIQHSEHGHQHNLRLAEPDQSAVATALQSAEQSGGPDLKGVVYNTLVQVLQNNGIDPTTFKPTSSSDAGRIGQRFASVSRFQNQQRAHAGHVGPQRCHGVEQSAFSARLVQHYPGFERSVVPVVGSSGRSGIKRSPTQILDLENDNQGSSELAALISDSANTSQGSSDPLAQS